MTRFVFHYTPDLTRPDAGSTEVAVLTTAGESFRDFAWTVDFDSLGEHHEFIREVAATLPLAVRAVVDEYWPAYAGQYRSEGFAAFVCRAFRHGNFFVSRVHNDEATP